MTALDTLKAAFEASLKPTPTTIAVLLAIVLIFPVVLHYLYTATTPYATLPSVLLVGPSGAGKTALLTLFERGPLHHNQQQQHQQQQQQQERELPEKPLVTSPVAQTHTSQVPTAVELAVSADGGRTSSYRDDLDAAGAAAKKFMLVDTPGHPKLRGEALGRVARGSGTLPHTAGGGSTSTRSGTTEKGKSKLKAVVFMVDAAALADSDGDGVSTAAEYLYEVLLALQRRAQRAAGKGGSRSGGSGAGMPVLVAANKQDLFTALPAALVRSQLEGEIGRIRKARSKGLLDSGVGADDDGPAGDDGDDWLGEYGSDKFTFKQMLEFDIEVDVIGGNVVGDGPGADRWWKWIGDRI